MSSDHPSLGARRTSLTKRRACSNVRVYRSAQRYRCTDAHRRRVAERATVDLSAIPPVAGVQIRQNARPPHSTLRPFSCANQGCGGERGSHLEISDNVELHMVGVGADRPCRCRDHPTRRRPGVAGRSGGKAALQVDQRGADGRVGRGDARGGLAGLGFVAQLGVVQALEVETSKGAANEATAAASSARSTPVPAQRTSADSAV